MRTWGSDYLNLGSDDGPVVGVMFRKCSIALTASVAGVNADSAPDAGTKVRNVFADRSAFREFSPEGTTDGEPSLSAGVFTDCAAIDKAAAWGDGCVFGGTLASHYTDADAGDLTPVAAGPLDAGLSATGDFDWEGNADDGSIGAAYQASAVTPGPRSVLAYTGRTYTVGRIDVEPSAITAEQGVGMRCTLDEAFDPVTLSGYAVLITATGLDIVRYDDDIPTVLASVAVTINAGDTIGIRCTGSTIQARHNGSTVGSATDATYASGRAVLLQHDDALTSFDNAALDAA